MYIKRYQRHVNDRGGHLQIWYAGMGGKGILADEPLDLPNKLLARPCMNPDLI